VKDPRFLIISEPRTGSNNISYCLNAHPDLVVGNELLHPGNGIPPADYGLDNEIAIVHGGRNYHWISRAGNDLRKDVLTGLFSRHNGFKIHTQHIPVEQIVGIAREYDCRIILTKRLSLFDQAISNYIATARNRWHADEKMKNLIDTQPFEVSIDHFTQWVEGILDVRRALWTQMKDLADRIVLVEYESFYSGSFEARKYRVYALYQMLGLKPLDTFGQEVHANAHAKLEHYLSHGRQKLTDEETVRRLISNFEEIQQYYALWVMRSYGKLAII
jgi:hypothetical protein